jgi:riboflavin transporter FmnP
MGDCYHLYTTLVFMTVDDNLVGHVRTLEFGIVAVTVMACLMNLVLLLPLYRLWLKTQYSWKRHMACENVTSDVFVNT